MPLKLRAEPAATRAWKLYLGFGLVAIVGHFGLGHGDAQGVVYLLVEASGVLALVLGVHRNRPEPATAWYLLGAGLALFLVGDVWFYFYKLVRDIDRPFPSLADAFYLASYPLQILGLLAIIRRRTPGGDPAGLIDACIVATGVGLLAQVYLIGPLVTADTPWPERIISAATRSPTWPCSPSSAWPSPGAGGRPGTASWAWRWRACSPRTWVTA